MLSLEQSIVVSLVVVSLSVIIVFRRKIISYLVGTTFKHQFVVKAAYQHPEIYRFTTEPPKIPTTEEEVNEERDVYSSNCFKFSKKSSKVELQSIEDVSVQVSDKTFIKVRVYVPSASVLLPPPALVYIHGGGWCLGDVESHDLICQHLASLCSCIVFSIDCRRSPEFQYPIPLQDCFDCTKWIMKQHDRFGFKENCVFIGGDSTGGNLAAALIFKIKDHASKLFPLIKGQILFYPATNYNFSSKSYSECGDGYQLTKDSMKQFWKLYLGKSSGKSCYESPLLGKMKDIPPTFITTASFDPLRDDGMSYAEKLLKESGTLVQYHNYHTMHGYLNLCSNFDMAMDTFNRLNKFITTFAANSDISDQLAADGDCPRQSLTKLEDDFLSNDCKMDDNLVKRDSEDEEKENVTSPTSPYASDCTDRESSSSESTFTNN